MGARRYGPHQGRFLQADSYLGAVPNLNLSTDPLTSNRYAFAAGNPVTYIDPTGHELRFNGSGTSYTISDLEPGGKLYQQDGSGADGASRGEAAVGGVGDGSGGVVSDVDPLIERADAHYAERYRLLAAAEAEDGWLRRMWHGAGASVEEGRGIELDAAATARVRLGPQFERLGKAADAIEIVLNASNIEETYSAGVDATGSRYVGAREAFFATQRGVSGLVGGAAGAIGGGLYCAAGTVLAFACGAVGGAAVGGAAEWAVGMGQDLITRRVLSVAESAFGWGT